MTWGLLGIGAGACIAVYLASRLAEEPEARREAVGTVVVASSIVFCSVVTEVAIGGLLTGFASRALPAVIGVVAGYPMGVRLTERDESRSRPPLWHSEG